MPESMDLTTDVCVRLLREEVVGRVALCAADGPHIVPLSYAVVEDAVVFRTSPYSLLGTVGRNSLLAFEIDHIDGERQHSWSVVVRGRCQCVDDPTVVAAISTTHARRPRVAGSRHLYLRLPWRDISGRKLGLHWDPLEELALRRAGEGEAV